MNNLVDARQRYLDMLDQLSGGSDADEALRLQLELAVVVIDAKLAEGAITPTSAPPPTTE